MLINFELLKHPMNWLVVLFMLVIAGAIGHYALSLLGKEPATAKFTAVPASSGLIPATDVVEAINPQSATNLS